MIYRTGSRLVKLLMRYTMYLQRRSLHKRLRTQRGPSTSSCRIQAVVSTMCARSVRRGLRTSGLTPCKNGCGLTQSWWVIEHIMPHAVPRQREIENPHQAYHDARQSLCWESERQRRVLRHRRLEYRKRLGNDMGILFIWRE